MKRILLLPILLFVFLKANAQSDRWMYLGVTNGNTLMIDTLKDDIKQLDSYDFHANVVLLWSKTLKKTSNKKGSYTEKVIMRIAVDTAINQIGITSISMYHNDNLSKSKKFDYVSWQDAIPESPGDVFIRYCKALNNPQLMNRFIANAKLYNHALSSPPQKSKSN